MFFLFQQTTLAFDYSEKMKKKYYVFTLLLGVSYVHLGGQLTADHKQKVCLKIKQSFKLSF